MTEEAEMCDEPEVGCGHPKVVHSSESGGCEWCSHCLKTFAGWREGLS